MAVVRTVLALAVSGPAAAARLPAQAVEEGLVVRQLRFTGNHSFEPFVLAAAIATTNSSWFARFGGVRWLGLGEKRRLNEREFRRDVARLRLFYQIPGFLEAPVDTSVVPTEPDAYITLPIPEGPPPPCGGAPRVRGGPRGEQGPRPPGAGRRRGAGPAAPARPAVRPHPARRH